MRREKIKESLTGFTLLEILVSLLILSIVITGIMSVFIASRRYIVRSRHRLQAANLARQVLEGLYKDVRQDTWDTGGLSVGSSKNCGISCSLDNISCTCRYSVNNVSGYDYRKVDVTINWTEPSP